MCSDGGGQNRQFMKMNFRGDLDQVVQLYAMTNPYNPSEKVAYIMDPKVGKT